MKDDEMEGLSAVARARKAIAELERKLVVEKRVTTEDLVAHLAAMSDVLTEMTQTLLRLSEAALCVVDVNQLIQQHTSESPSGNSAGATR